MKRIKARTRGVTGASTRLAPLLVALLAAASPAPAAAGNGQAAAERRQAVEQGVRDTRRDVRTRQNVLSPGELREAERRLDTIEKRAATDPRAAQDMLRILRADESLATINRPIPGGSPTPGLVGPGERE